MDILVSTWDNDWVDYVFLSLYETVSKYKRKWPAVSTGLTEKEVVIIAHGGTKTQHLYVVSPTNLQPPVYDDKLP